MAHNAPNCCASPSPRRLSHSMSANVGSPHRGPWSLANSSTARRAAAASHPVNWLPLSSGSQVFHQNHEVTGRGLPFGVVAAGHADVDRRSHLEVEAHLALVVAQGDAGGPAGGIG